MRPVRANLKRKVIYILQRMHLSDADRKTSMNFRSTAMKKLVFVVIGMAMLIVLTGTVLADPGVPQTPETQGFATLTSVQAVGTVTETDSLVWQLTNASALAKNSVGLAQDQVQYVSSYTENTIADQGLVSYARTMEVDTANKVGNQYNVRADKVVEFIGSDTGRMISEESLLLDGAGREMETAGIMLCPFASTAYTLYPAFCNIIEVGSTADVTIASLTTSADERHVMATADPNVAVDYTTKVTGFGDIPAMGSATAYINVHIQEGRQGYNARLNAIQGPPLGKSDDPKAEDLVYSEVSTASGEISLFDKVIGYQSGMRRY
jgi:hypothetical protein